MSPGPVGGLGTTLWASGERAKDPDKRAGPNKGFTRCGTRDRLSLTRAHGFKEAVGFRLLSAGGNPRILGKKRRRDPETFGPTGTEPKFNRE